jgi:hypothetical protein
MASRHGRLKCSGTPPIRHCVFIFAYLLSGDHDAAILAADP